MKIKKPLLKNKRGNTLISLLVVFPLIGMSLSAMQAMQRVSVRNSLNGQSNSEFRNITNSLQLALANPNACKTAFPGLDLTPIRNASASPSPSPTAINGVTVKIGNEVIAAPGLKRGTLTINDVIVTEVSNVQRTACGGGKTSYALNVQVNGTKKKDTFVGNQYLAWNQKVFLIADDANNSVTGCSITSDACGGTGTSSSGSGSGGLQETGNLFANGDFGQASPISFELRTMAIAPDGLPYQSERITSSGAITGSGSVKLSAHYDYGLGFYWRRNFTCDPILSRATSMKVDFDAKLVTGNGAYNFVIDPGYTSGWRAGDQTAPINLTATASAGGVYHFTQTYTVDQTRQINSLSFWIFGEGTTNLSLNPNYYYFPTEFLLDNVVVKVTYDPSKPMPSGC